MRDERIDQICATLRRGQTLEADEIADLLEYIDELETRADPVLDVSESLLQLQLRGKTCRV